MGTHFACCSMMIIGSVQTFIGAALYVEKIQKSCHKMIRLRIFATFFQTAELTTLVKVRHSESRADIFVNYTAFCLLRHLLLQISWPRWVYISFSLPFQIPMSDAMCLAASSGWDYEYTFFASFYGSIFVFLFLTAQIRSSPSRSSLREVKLLQVAKRRATYTYLIHRFTCCRPKLRPHLPSNNLVHAGSEAHR